MDDAANAIMSASGCSRRHHAKEFVRLTSCSPWILSEARPFRGSSLALHFLRHRTLPLYLDTTNLSPEPESTQFACCVRPVPNEGDKQGTSPARLVAYSCFHVRELAIMLRQWTFAAGWKDRPPRGCMHTMTSPYVIATLTFLRGEPCAVHLEFARAFARGGDWRDLVPGGGAGASLLGAAGPVAADSRRAVR